MNRAAGRPGHCLGHGAFRGPGLICAPTACRPRRSVRAAAPQRRGELALDVGVEAGAVHRTVQDPGCDQPVMSKARNEGLRVPVAEGCGVDEALADGGPAGRFDEVGLERRFALRTFGSSMNTSVSSMLAMSGWHISIQTLRRSATSGHRISLARSVFFYG